VRGIRKRMVGPKCPKDFRTKTSVSDRPSAHGWQAYPTYKLQMAENHFGMLTINGIDTAVSYLAREIDVPT
jgi:hypothetical protein